MRICLYTESALPLVGGQEIVVDQLAREFQNFGHEVVVLAAQHRGRAVIRDDELPYPVVRHPRFISTHRLVGWYRRYVDRLRRQFAFDVLHCHSVQPAGYVAACCRSLADVRVVITSHGGDICPEEWFLKKPGAMERCTKALARADAVVAISEFIEERLRAIAPNFQAMERITNGVRYDRFATPVERPAAINSSVMPSAYLLFLGRIIHRKGVDLLLQAFGKAQLKTNARLVVAGTGSELDAMRLLTQQLGIAARTHFVGHVDSDVKTWLLQNAIATVMPSRGWEGLPLVMMESFAAGRPVIAAETPGLKELVTPGRTGFLVAPESSADLASAISEVIGNPTNTDRLGAIAQRLAMQHDWSAVARRHLDLFARLLSEPRLCDKLRRPAA